MSCVVALVAEPQISCCDPQDQSTDQKVVCCCRDGVPVLLSRIALPHHTLRAVWVHETSAICCQRGCYSLDLCSQLIRRWCSCLGNVCRFVR